MRFSFPTCFAFLAIVILLTGCATNHAPKTVAAPAASSAYDYPINNPYAATIIGTPLELRKAYTGVPVTDVKHLTVFPDRQIPEGFWHEPDLRYGEILQTHAAPVIYILAGTGADYSADYMQTLGAAFYQAGYHVILLPSTTHPNFIITASENFLPGRPSQSAKDLYRVIKMIDRKVSEKTKITGHYLTGYSLGAMDAAFTAELDSREQAINFQKTLLINPPYNLYSSIQRIDQMLYVGLPEGLNGVNKFIDTELGRLATVSPSGDALDFQNARLLVEAYSKYPAGDERLATTIGLAFRLFAANMIFTSDVMAHTGYIFPSNVALKTTTPMNEYLSVSIRTGLLNYFQDVYVPRYLAANPNMTREQLIAESSLQSIAPYLANNPKIGLVTNRDDIILAPGELQKMANLFGGNAMIYPNGGHLGNLTYPPVTENIVRFIGGAR